MFFPLLNMLRPRLFLVALWALAIPTVWANKEANSHFVTLPYGLPSFAMKLLVLDGGNFSVVGFQAALEDIVRAHLEENLATQLPEQPDADLLSRGALVNVTVRSVMEHTPVDPLLSDGIPVAVVRAAFDGVGLFNVSRASAVAADIPLDADVLNSTDLPSYVGVALEQHFGFWDLAAAMANDTILSITGKLQIAIDGVIVAEGSLVGEPAEEEEEPTLSPAAMITIGIIIALFLVVFLATVLYVRHLNHEADLERKKLERREQARKVRRRVRVESDTKADKSTRDDSEEDDDLEAAWMDTKARQVSTVPDRLAKSAQQKQALIAVPKSRLRSRPALEAKKSNDALLHCIAEEDESSHNDSSSRFMDARQDDVESLYCLLKNDDIDNQSQSSNSSRLWRQSSSGAIETAVPPPTRSTNASIARPPPEMFKSSFSNTARTTSAQEARRKQESFDILGTLGSVSPTKTEANSNTLLRHDGDPITSSDDSNAERIIT